MRHLSSSWAIVCVIFLAGCGAVAPLKPDAVDAVRKAKTAVAFYDGMEQINYIADQYFVLGVAQIASNSAYHGLWDSNKDLSALNAEELTKIGVQSQSVYRNRSVEEVAQIDSWSKAVYDDLHPTAKGPKKNPATSLAPVAAQFREALLASGYDQLIWVSWTGYTLHMQTLGLPTLSKLAPNFRIFDLHQDKVIWEGTIIMWEKTEMNGATGKEFLEQNNLAGLRNEVARVFHERYKVRDGHGVFNSSVGQIIGLEPKASQK